jgi:hypothetical protein
MSLYDSSWFIIPSKSVGMAFLPASGFEVGNPISADLGTPGEDRLPMLEELVLIGFCFPVAVARLAAVAD